MMSYGPSRAPGCKGIGGDAFYRGVSGAFVAVDASGQIVTWSAQAEAAFGWSRRDAVGRSLADTLIPPSLRDGYVDAMRRFLDTLDAPVVGKRLTVTVRNRSGRECPMAITVTAMRLGAGVYCGAFLQRVTTA